MQPERLSSRLTRTQFQRWYPVLLAMAAAWAVFNCADVYFALDGARTYLIESSVYVFVLLALPAVALRGREPTRTDSTAPPARIVVALAVVAWLLVLVPLASAPFLSDDYVFLGVYGPSLNLGFRWEFFRPAFGVVFWGLARIGNRSPVPFHLAALILHVTVARLVYVLARRVSASALQATIAFVAFLLSPLQLEATLWISGLQELMCSACALGAVVIHTGNRRLSPWRVAGAASLAACALLSKETAACFVLLFVLFDFALFRMRRGPGLAAAYSLYVAVLVAYLLIRRAFLSLDPRLIAAPTPFFLKQFLAIPFKTFVQPWNSEAIAIPAIIAFVSATIAIALLFVVVVLRKASPRLLIGPAIILIGTVPLYGLFYVGPNLASARYLYLPAVGWALTVAYLLRRSVDDRRSTVAILIALLAVQTTSLALNTRPWRTAIDVVERVSTAVRDDSSVDEVVGRLRRELGPDLHIRDGVPRDYHGVAILQNGYSEFIALVRARKSI